MSSINKEVSDIVMAIGRNVKKYRLLKGFTQQNLAFRCDPMDKSTVSNIECGNFNGLNIKTLIKISLALEVQIQLLFENNNE